ncbi:Multifunctional tryptophan biosynthesis protein [Hypsizygus marmoreus]|uniref:Multifunctional tryptophan biosynthesis protein n=1 Tax=Hypsizygus marmoreus TaxID=39966 RepID=A0A369JZS9_HYPMA|nr:Multifunctional tryptophan biosynthesis protein [Hypsizygus marmoreus]
MSTPTILEKIYAQRAKDVELAKSTPGTTPADIAALLASHLAPPLIPLVSRLARNPSTDGNTPSPSLMAEIKRASPSKGPIAPNANAAAQALTYALAGASVISVLTEPTWFLGSLLDLRLVRQAIDTLPDRPAVLRKEFILDEYQIAEARLHGADTILLIVAMLPVERLRALYTYSLSLGMEPLVEVNNATEMQTALDLGAKVIGVNNRNLHDFNVDMSTTSRLVDMVKDRDVILCSLSGISTPADVQLYQAQGVRAVLIGEALMRAPFPSTFIRELLNWPSPSSSSSPQDSDEHEKPLLMISGITIIEEAISFISEEGVDMLGLVFDAQNQNEDSIIDEPNDFARNLAIYRRSDPRYFAPRTFPPSSDPAPWFAAQKRNLLATAVRPLLVGIFRNHTLPEIIHTTAAVKLDLVVLDDSVPLGWIKHIPVPVIRRFRAGTDLRNAEIALPGLHSFVLLEQEKGKDLSAVVDVVGRGEAPGWPMPVILGGALTEESLKEALGTIRPWAVEISIEEGVEESMSPSEMQKLIKVVKRA